MGRASRLPLNVLPTQARRPRYIQKSKSKLLLVSLRLDCAEVIDSRVADLLHQKGFADLCDFFGKCLALFLVPFKSYLHEFMAGQEPVELRKKLGRGAGFSQLDERLHELRAALELPQGWLFLWHSPPILSGDGFTSDEIRIFSIRW